MEIPHIMLDNGKISIKKKEENITSDSLAIAQPNKKQSIFSKKEEDIFDIMRKWALIISVALVIIYAGWRIIVSLF